MSSGHGAPRPSSMLPGVRVDWDEGKVYKTGLEDAVEYHILTFVNIRPGYYSVQRITRTNQVNIGRELTLKQLGDLLSWYDTTTDIRWENNAEKAIRKVAK